MSKESKSSSEDEKTRKTSIDLDEKTYMQLKYISMRKETSMKKLMTTGILEVIQKHKDLLPDELK